MPRFVQMAGGGLIVASAAACYLYINHPDSAASRQSTDDAYIQADYTNVAARLSGVVENVLIEENQAVSRGDILAVLDDRDFTVAVDNARAAVAISQANLDTAQAQVRRQGALIVEAQATIDADDAVLKLARANEARYRELEEKGSATQQALDQAESSLGTAIANRASHIAALDAANRQLEILNAQVEGARATLAQAKAGLSDANLKLSYTRIVAPISGSVGQKTLRTGAFVSPGSTLLSIVPLDRLYVRANFRETQLARVKAGQRTEIKVDALPGRIFKGVVESLGPASGVSFSAIAPQNATGNFTKIVQRLPVRILIDRGQPGIEGLRVGMSVIPEIVVE